MAELKKDCVHYIRKPNRYYYGCDKLECLQCTNKECTFYETEEQYDARQMAHIERMRELPEDVLGVYKDKGYKVFGLGV